MTRGPCTSLACLGVAGGHADGLNFGVLSRREGVHFLHDAAAQRVEVLLGKKEVPFLKGGSNELPPGGRGGEDRVVII